MIEILGWVFDFGDIVAGGVRGLAYALMAVGIVLVYRSSGVLNFANASIGAMGGVLLSLFARHYGWNYWLSILIAIAAGAALSAAVELTVVRRLFKAPRLVLFIATLGVAQLVFVLTIKIIEVSGGSAIPTAFSSAPGARFSVFGLFDFPLRVELAGGVTLLARDLSILILAPLAILVLSLFLTRTKLGLAVRASADNPDAAQVFGISVKRTSTVVWTIAGALSVLTVALVAPYPDFPTSAASTDPLSFTLLLRVLAVALLARMRSLPLAIVAGVGVGVVEIVVLRHYPTSQQVFDLCLFALVLVTVLVAGRRSAPADSWSLVPRVDAVPARLRELWWVRRLDLFAGLLGMALLAAIPVLTNDPGNLAIYTEVLIFALIGLTITMLTGWAGQLSLGQFAFVGLGALVTMTLRSNEGWPFLPALAVAVAVGVVAAVIIGIPALRIRGLYLAVTTLAFSVAAASWLFKEDFLRQRGEDGALLTSVPGQAPLELGWLDLSGRRAFFWTCWVVLAVALVVIGHLRRTGVGRALIGIRENEDLAAACTVSSTRMKLFTFALSGGLASLAGGLMLMNSTGFSATTEFSPSESTRVVAIAIIGGLGTLAGPVLGALWVIGIPAVFDNSTVVPLLTSGIGLLVLLMYFPGGLVQLLDQARGFLLGIAERRLPEKTPPLVVPPITLPVPVRGTRGLAATPGRPVLAVEDVSVRFGGRLAVDRVSLAVMPGEIVGLIGSNGAGKSTLMNAIGGYVPATGRIEVLGRDVAGMAPHLRHAAGLGRSFQSSTLFGELTVRETIKLALEARERSGLASSLLALPSSGASERRKNGDANDIISFIGLGRYADTMVSVLSTGTRRIVELATLLASEAKMILLDEPTGGVAQRESEAFGPLLRRIRVELDASMLIIEHDMPLVMSISDRVYCLEAGRLISAGTPDVVRHDPLVVASYLGTDPQAIERSDAPAPSPLIGQPLS